MFDITTLTPEQRAELLGLLKKADRKDKGIEKRKVSLCSRYLRRGIVALRKLDSTFTAETALSFMLAQYRDNEYSVKADGESIVVSRVDKETGEETSEDDASEDDASEDDAPA